MCLRSGKGISVCRAGGTLYCLHLCVLRAYAISDFSVPGAEELPDPKHAEVPAAAQAPSAGVASVARPSIGPPAPAGGVATPAG